MHCVQNDFRPGNRNTPQVERPVKEKQISSVLKLLYKLSSGAFSLLNCLGLGLSFKSIFFQCFGIFLHHCLSHFIVGVLNSESTALKTLSSIEYLSLT